jgi:phosphoribosyl 1,2-cyclic phosphate phosphodiesterase
MEGAVEAAERIGAQRTYFTHMAHDLPHAETCDGLPETICLAYDGLVCQVSEKTNETVLRDFATARL